MPTYVRSTSVSTTEATDNFALATSVGWLDVEVPEGFDAGAGDTLSFAVTANIGSDAEMPEGFTVSLDVIVAQMNGGVMNAGPYTGTGFTYTIGSRMTQFGDMSGVWFASGLQSLDTGQGFSTSVYSVEIVDGTPTYPSEGAVYIDEEALFETCGWSALQGMRQTEDTGYALLSEAGFTILFYLQNNPLDFSNPSRSMWTEIRSVTMVWTPGIGTPVAYELDPLDIVCGFNAGSAGTAPGKDGPYTYSALATVNASTPAVSSRYQNFFTYTPAPPGPGLNVGSVILVGCAQALITAVLSATEYQVTIIGSLEPYAVPNDPNGLIGVVPEGEWEYVNPVTSMSGLEFLNGKEVQILADGLVVGPATVSGGSVSWSGAASNVIVGLSYQGQLKTLYLNTEGIQRGTMQGKRKQITGVTARVSNTLGLQSGTNFDQLSNVPQLISPTEGYIEGFTGDARNIAFPDWNDKGEVCIQQDLPLPASVLGIIVEVTPGDTGQ